MLAAAFLFCAPRGADKFIKVYFPDGRSVTAEPGGHRGRAGPGPYVPGKDRPRSGDVVSHAGRGLPRLLDEKHLIPLDILWLDEDRRIVHIESDAAVLRRSLPVLRAVAAGIVRPGAWGGGADRYGLKLFDRLDFVLPNPPR